jgi:hypothetical protein
MPGGSYRYSSWIAAFLLVIAGSSFLWIGCGQKGPPRPPRRPLPPQVRDLAFTINDGAVELTWTVGDRAERGVASPATVRVFRSRLSAEEAGCKNCPIRYTVSDDIPILKRRTEESEPVKMRYTEPVETGYRYIFKVIVYDENGNGSRDSNIVKFDH